MVILLATFTLYFRYVFSLNKLFQIFVAKKSDYQVFFLNKVFENLNAKIKEKHKN